MKLAEWFFWYAKKNIFQKFSFRSVISLIGPNNVTLYYLEVIKGVKISARIWARRQLIGSLA